MKIIERSFGTELLKRLSGSGYLLQVVAGPRQVGKTTLVNQVLEKLKFKSKYITADGVSNSESFWLEEQWNLVRLEQKQSKKLFVFAIDEIQKINNWSETVKRLWDEDRRNNTKIKVVILGSSKLLLQQGLTESLTGRFEMTHIPHWRYKEMKEAFSFTPEQYVYFGAYPGATGFIKDEARWSNYIRDAFVETSISKDVLMLARIDKPALLKKLFELGSQYSGKILSLTKVMGQLQDAGNTTTLTHYLSLLDGAGLLCGLNKYTKDAARSRASVPKFQVYNTALSNAYLNISFKQAKADPKLWGNLVESAIGAHLLSYKNTGLEVKYWREGDKEVDFILEYKNKVVALEVKTTFETSKGLEQFKKNYSNAKIYKIGPGSLDWKAFLGMSPLELF